jgi:hypothetical protein
MRRKQAERDWTIDLVAEGLLGVKNGLSEVHWV